LISGHVLKHPPTLARLDWNNSLGDRLSVELGGVGRGDDSDRRAVHLLCFSWRCGRDDRWHRDSTTSGGLGGRERILRLGWRRGRDNRWRQGGTTTGGLCEEEPFPPPLVGAASETSNVFWGIWSTSSSTSGPFELVEVLLPPALLFPNLLAEEDVLLDFAELLVFLDFDPLSDLHHGSDSDFKPLLHEDWR
jgi:hypothetical protein